MIVVEGFDCSGKSTLAARIGDMLGWPVLHAGGPPGSLSGVIEGLARCEERWCQPVIQDRITHISESAYSHLASPRTAACALTSIQHIPWTVMVIYCRPPTEFLLDAFQHAHTRQAWDTDAHLNQVRRDAQAIITFYDTVMAMVSHRCRVYTYDRSTDPTADAILAEVKSKFIQQSGD